jgi:hypothetical protein
MTADIADVPDAPDPRDAEPPLADRRLPLGIIVVVILQIGRLVIETVNLLVVEPTGFAAWITPGSTIPAFEPWTPEWYVGRVAVILMIVVTAASVIGLLQFRTWGWSLALILAGLVLALDIGWWLAGQPRYPGMALNMVAVFYLNQRDVRAIFLPSSL